MESKKRTVIQYIPFAIFFLLLLFFSLGVEIKSDDVSYMVNRVGEVELNVYTDMTRISSISEAIINAFDDYLEFNSRILTNIITMSVLRYGKTLYILFNPLMATAALFFGLNLNDNGSFCFKNLINCTICLICFYSISSQVLNETVFWITGSINYLWVLPFAILLFRLLISEENKKSIILKDIIYAYSALRVGFAPENISFSFLAFSVMIIAYKMYIVKEKSYLTQSRVVAFVLLWASSLAEIASPGNWKKYGLNNASVFQKLFSGYKFFISSQFCWCGVIACMLMFLLSIYIKKYSKVLSFLSVVMPLPLFIIIGLSHSKTALSYIYNHSMTSLILDPINTIGIADSRIKTYIAIAYFTSLSIIVFAEMLIVLIKEKNIELTSLIVMSALPNLVIFAIGGASERAALPSHFFMIITIGYLLNNTENFNRTEIYSVFVLVFVAILSFSNRCSYLSSNVAVSMVRESIYKDIKNGMVADNIVIPKYRFSFSSEFNTNFYDEFGFTKFYLGRDENITFTHVDRSEFGINW